MDKNSHLVTRRSFLGTAASLMILGPRFPAPLGWIPPVTRRSRSFYDVSGLDNFGKNKAAFLCNAYKKVTKRDWSTRMQFRGDCVGVAGTTAIDFLNCTQTLQRKSSWKGRHSIVAHYVGARAQGGKTLRGDGARTEWIVKFFQEYGVLLEKEYGQDDLRKWDSKTYSRYARGLTDNLKIAARLHPLMHAESINSYEEARDSIAAGFPIVIGSTLGVAGAKKDKDGFFKPRGWTPHCMCCIGVEDKDRPSILIQNSHGPNWAPGKKRYGFEPEGSAWIDAEYFDRYVGGDTYTLSLFRGYKVKRRYILW